MFVRESGLGDLSGNVLKNFESKVKDFNMALLAPAKELIRKPSSAFNLRKQWNMGTNMGKKLEATIVATNPLDPYLQKFNEAGMKKGGKLGKFLGRTGELARKKPLAATAIVYGGVLAGKALLGAKGAAAAAGTGTAATGTGTAAVGAGTAAAGGLTAAEVGAGITAAGATAKLVETVAGGKTPEGEEVEYVEDTGEDIDKSSDKLKAVLAGMIEPKNLLLFTGLSALSVAGYLLFKQHEKK